MKRLLLFSLLLTFTGTVLLAQKPATPAPAGGYNIKITLKDYSASEIYLG